MGRNEAKDAIGKAERSIYDPLLSFTTPLQTVVFKAVLEERHRQDEKWGRIEDRLDLPLKETAYPELWANFAEVLERHARASLEREGGNWTAVLVEEVGEALNEVAPRGAGVIANRKDLRKELIQVAAVCVAIIEAMDLGGAP